MVFEFADHGWEGGDMCGVVVKVFEILSDECFTHRSCLSLSHPDFTLKYFVHSI